MNKPVEFPPSTDITTSVTFSHWHLHHMLVSCDKMDLDVCDILSSASSIYKLSFFFNEIFDSSLATFHSFFLPSLALNSMRINSSVDHQDSHLRSLISTLFRWTCHLLPLWRCLGKSHSWWPYCEYLVISWWTSTMMLAQVRCMLHPGQIYSHKLGRFCNVLTQLHSINKTIHQS